MKRLTANWKRYLSYLLMLLSFGALVITAILGAGKKPPTLREVIVLALVSGGLQLAGASLLNSIGRADPTLARSAVRTLKDTASYTKKARVVAEQAREVKSAAELKDAVGRLSVYLSVLEEQIAKSIADWQEVHSSAIAELLGEDPDNEPN